MLTAVIQQIKSAPKDPGIYIFYRGRIPLYVGKASNLKNRLKSYLAITDLKTKSLHQEADSLKIIPLRSNIEALIIESQYIKTLKPRYNILWRDDSSYAYVFITDDAFPKIFAGHATDKNRFYQNSRSIGPFTDAAALKTVLRLLRKYFPYCTCLPAGRPAHLPIFLNAQINNYPRYCFKKQAAPEKKEKISYRKNIAAIASILSEKNKKFIKKLRDPYELLILDKIWAHQPYLDSMEKNAANSSLASYEKIECYDNSHLSGKEAVGAMTAWRQQTTNNGQLTTWVADKSMWRKFKIRGNYTEDDPRMMYEMLSRRLNHPEWPYPDLIIIDGGITQYNAAKRAVSELGIKNKGSGIKVISFAKPHQLIFGLKKHPVPISKSPADIQRIIPVAIQTTHNFVIRYHRKIRRRMFLK